MNKQLSFVGLLSLLCCLRVAAQQPQIPTLQVCNLTSAMTVSSSNPPPTATIPGRKDATHTGSFTVAVKVGCAANGYPNGSLTISAHSMTDSIIQGTITATTFEQLTSTGTDTPTAFLNGRCEAANAVGCRYWIMFVTNTKLPAPNQPTDDVISFLVLDKNGKRIAYGTGPVVRGHIDVSPTPF
jgi:hypothetical protein